MNTTRVMTNLAAVAIVASAFFGSAALAGAPGNTVDKDGCEWHHNTGKNNCNSGSTSPRISVNTSGKSYCVANPGGTSAYAALQCTSGDLYRGLVGAGGLAQCAACSGTDVPTLSICGSNSACMDKP